MLRYYISVSNDDLNLAKQVIETHAKTAAKWPEVEFDEMHYGDNTAISPRKPLELDGKGNPKPPTAWDCFRLTETEGKLLAKLGIENEIMLSYNATELTKSNAPKFEAETDTQILQDNIEKFETHHNTRLTPSGVGDSSTAKATLLNQQQQEHVR